jgi:hypothetical protein
MHRFAACASLLLLLLGAPLLGLGRAAPAPLPGQSYAELRARAEALAAEGSARLAREVYLQAEELELAAEERRWVEFRLADLGWRSAPERTDSSEVEVHLEQLARLSPPTTRIELRDRVWAEAQASLGDYHWARQRTWSSSPGFEHYGQALDWWARSSELELARERWLALFWTMAQPPWAGASFELNYSRGNLSLERAEQAVQLARNDAERARAGYVLAVLLGQRSGEPRIADRYLEQLRAVRAFGRDTGVYDAALYAEALHLELRDEQGHYQREPDLRGALALYRQLLAEFEREESAFAQPASLRIRGITEPQLTVWTPGAFLPGSQTGYGLHWRNVARIDLALYPLDLDRDLELTDTDDPSSNWLQVIDEARLEALRRWTVEGSAEGDHAPAQRQFALAPELPRGAYLIEARAGDLAARDLLLVTDAALVVRGAGDGLVLWAVGATDGQPLADAELTVRARLHRGSWFWREFRLRSDADGLARIELGELDYADVIATVKHGDDQAISFQWAHAVGEPERRRALATTDRPAYRPGQEVLWSLVARQWSDGGWVAERGDDLSLRVIGPRGDRVFEGPLALSDFGTAHGALRTEEAWTLGLYQLELYAGGDRHLATAPFFRLEEYRLPELEVTVALPTEEDGRRATFVLGDEVRAEVTARTYAGPPVAGAEVELVVRRAPHWDRPEPRRAHDWFQADSGYEDFSYGRFGRWTPPAEEVLRTSTFTDADGRAQVRFETSAFESQSYRYTIEARVTDSLRREVSGSGSVIVARQAFTVLVDTGHRLFAPGVPVDATVTTADANGAPLSVAGHGVLLRLESFQREQWLARGGGLLPPGASFPYTAEEELLRVPLRTGADGRVQWAPTLPRAGTYLLRFVAADERGGGEVAGEARIHGVDGTTTDVGYRSGGIELVLDADAAGEGQAAQVMVVADRSGRAVLFMELVGPRLEARVLRLAGTAKLVSVELAARHVPRVEFTVCAVDGGRLLEDRRSLTVPPTQRVLDIEAQLEREDYEPGEEATLAVRVTGAAGEPVAAELALSLFDEALTAVQGELGSDPRVWFYGRGFSVNPTRGESLGWKPHAVFEFESETGGFVDRRERIERELLPEELRDRAAAGRGGGDLSKSRGVRQDFGALEQFGYLGAPAVSAESSADFFLGVGQGPASPGPGGRSSAAEGEAAPIALRVDFRETAVFEPALRTDAEGRAELRFRWPDSTTRWRLSATGVDDAARFGVERRSAARTRLPLQLRLATPRFFVVGDEALISTLVRNDTEETVDAQLELSATGLELLGFLSDSGPHLIVEPGTERTLEWRVRAAVPGPALLRATVRGGARSDGIERTVPVLEHGLEVLIAASGAVDGERGTLRIELPPAKPHSTTIEVTVTPSLAATAIAALPYLADYPYGCLEQTLSRFVPTLVALHSLERLGLDRGAVAQAALVPELTTAPRPERAVTLEQIDRMAAEGLERVLSMQRGDGSFSWWPGGDGDAFMSGYALWSLSLARTAGLEVPEGVLQRTLAWIEGWIVNAGDDPVLSAWLLHAHAAARAALGSASSPRPAAIEAAFERCYASREALGAYGRALLLIVAQGEGRAEQAQVLLRNLEDGVILEDGPGGGVLSPDANTVGRRTARFGGEGLGHRWSEDGVEATATALRALLAVDPGHPLVEPTIEWLVLERRGSGWKSTRDTAICVLSLVEAVVARGEGQRSGELRMSVNGQEFGGSPPLDGLEPVRWRLDHFGLESGVHEFELRRTGGEGRLYWNVVARTFSVEPRIAPRANELVVRRDVYRLVGRETLLAGQVFERRLLSPGDAVGSGDRLEVVLTLQARTALEYLVVEDWKPAGFEAVELQSGGPAYARELRADEVLRRHGPEGFTSRETVGDALPDPDAGYTGQSRWVYRELRDTRQVSFIDRLPAGTWELRSTLRAETPGTFAALPAVGQAMYAPDLRGNSWELPLRVVP